MRSRMSDGCEIWKYNYSCDKWYSIVGNHQDSLLPSGFGNVKNLATSYLKVFKNKLYVGTWGSPYFTGCEIWRFDGNIWEQVVGPNSLTKGGFNNFANIAIWCIEEFNNYLYVGTMNWDFTDNGGCQIWRSKDGSNWTKVIDRGFRDFLENDSQNVHNTYAWCTAIFQDQLYVGTFNTNSIFSLENSGCQLWRTNDGIDWEKVDLCGGDGFGKRRNYGIRRMAVYNNELYVGTATDAYQINSIDVKGCEIWKYDGSNWTQIIGSERLIPYEKEGFGSNYNKYIWSMIVTSDNKLWVGTLNTQHNRGLREKTKGFEIWCYDGTSWTPIVKDNIGEINNGFGNIFNQGARAMIEYPEKSGNIVVGTFKMVKLKEFIDECEVWMRQI